MKASTKNTPVYVETGKHRTFAGALDWPGWCRSGADEASALLALAAYSSRYARVLTTARIEFSTPQDTAALVVVERLDGSSSTDFGVAAAALASDSQPVADRELELFTALLRACWAAFDATVQAVADKELRKGPRGGGRELTGVVEHVLGSESGYLAALGVKSNILGDPDNLQSAVEQTRELTLSTLQAAAHGEIAPRGPRGGLRWTPRYFVRRSAWHILDHAWELEDRAL